MLEIRQLSVSFSKGILALDHINLCVPDGKAVVVIGESGSGKSIMLAAILGLLPRGAQVSGSVTLDDVELIGTSERQLRKIRGRELAYIPQGSGSSLNPWATKSQNRLCNFRMRQSPAPLPGRSTG